MNNSFTNILDDLRLLEAPRPLTPLEWLGIVGAVLLVIGLFVWLRRRARQQPQPTAAMIEAAKEDALAELEKLRALISRGNSRRYAIEVSGVVRRYIERRFGLRAPRRSTEEFLVEAQASAKLDEQHRRNLADFLAACDFLKFARAFAEAPELEQIHQRAVRFVTDTQVPAEAAAPPAAQETVA